jgi:hypothetical protein
LQKDGASISEGHFHFRNKSPKNICFSVKLIKFSPQGVTYEIQDSLVESAIVDPGYEIRIEALILKKRSRASVSVSILQTYTGGAA